MPIAEIKDLCKVYTMGTNKVHALRNVDLSFEQGEFISIMGPSGSGKSTLLNLLGCLDRPTSGQYLLGDQDVAKMNDDALSAIRSEMLGFVFQSFNLLPQLNVVENIEVPLFYQGVPASEARRRATELAGKVGLGSRCDHKPTQLSGGQQQRVAIARALVNDPILILADEPTGNLDSKTGEEIMVMLQELHETGTTIVMVTHENEVAMNAEKVLTFRDGELVDTKAGNLASRRGSAVL